MTKLREFFQRRKCKKTISNIRKSMLFLDVDLSHLSDQEIEQKVVAGAKHIASGGMPASDFVRGLQRFAESARAVGAALVCLERSDTGNL